MFFFRLTRYVQCLNYVYSTRTHVKTNQNHFGRGPSSHLGDLKRDFIQNEYYRSMCTTSRYSGRSGEVILITDHSFGRVVNDPFYAISGTRVSFLTETDTRVTSINVSSNLSTNHIKFRNKTHRL